MLICYSSNRKLIQVSVKYRDFLPERQTFKSLTMSNFKKVEKWEVSYNATDR